MTHRFRHIALFTALILLLSAAACGTPRPEGSADGADALAERMVASVDGDAWKRTGAVTWTYGNRFNHLWDRKRQLARVRKGDLEVLVDLRTRKGVAIEDGVRLDGKKRDDAVEKGFKAWTNDSFWLTAMIKPFDPGTTRALVTQKDGSEALLVSYGSGGVTPGDAYLWHFDDNGRPESWQMWVSFVPIGGVSVTWEKWVQLRTGAWVPTSHDFGLFTGEVTDLDGAETIGQLVDGPDPFAPLLEAR